jgi:hypothetical protein
MILLLHSLSRQRRDTIHRSYRYSALLQKFFCITVFLLCINSKSIAAEKTINIKVNASGIITIGRDTVSSDDVAMYIRERLFKSYTGTGKMYDAIKLTLEGGPEQVVVDVVKKEIASGQKKALTELCLEKHKKLFEDISSRQKAKLKKNFKVLFQTSYD